MSLLSLASRSSKWRGYNYYKNNKILSCKKLNESRYIGTVKGSYQNEYTVLIDTDHPRSSKCNCPHADGKRIICKHMIALLFTAYPDMAEKYYEDIIRAEELEEERQEKLENMLYDYVNGLSKEEAQSLLLEVLFEAPEWQYDRFIEEHIYAYSDDDDDDDYDDWNID